MVDTATPIPRLPRRAGPVLPPYHAPALRYRYPTTATAYIHPVTARLTVYASDHMRRATLTLTGATWWR